MSLLRLKVSTYNAIRAVQRVIAGAVRLLPGSWQVLNVPGPRIPLLKYWIEREKLKFDWMERCKAAHYQKYRATEIVNRRPPRDTQGGPIHRAFTVERYHAHNEVFLARLPDARILGPSGAVITHDGGIVEESVWGYGWLEKDRALTALSLPKPEKLEGSFYTIASLSSEGYWHWISEALPRLFAIDQLLPDEIRVIVSRDLSEWQRDSLKVIGLGHLQFVPLNQRYVQTDVLFFPSFVGTPGNPHAWGYEWLRERMLRNVVPSRSNRRLYVTRRLAARRRLANEAELEPILSRHGFEVLETEGLSLREKAAIFSEAEIVVGVHGAGLTNILLSPAGCKVLEIFDPGHMNVNNYAAADVLGQPYWYLIGHDGGSAKKYGSAGHDDVYVPAKEFEQALTTVLKS